MARFIPFGKTVSCILVIGLVITLPAIGNIESGTFEYYGNRGENTTCFFGAFWTLCVAILTKAFSQLEARRTPFTFILIYGHGNLQFYYQIWEIRSRLASLALLSTFGPLETATISRIYPHCRHCSYQPWKSSSRYILPLHFGQRFWTFRLGIWSINPRLLCSLLQEHQHSISQSSDVLDPKNSTQEISTLISWLLMILY